MKRDDIVSKIEAIAEQIAGPHNIEIVEIELKGSGRSYLLRVYIDKPEGVTHADCELVSRGMSTVLDEEDPIPGTYELEVSSPGIERKLMKWKDWERFTGKKIVVVLKEPAEIKSFDGLLVSAADDTLAVELTGGKQIVFPFEQVERAHLKFEW